MKRSFFQALALFALLTIGWAAFLLRNLNGPASSAAVQPDPVSVARSLDTSLSELLDEGSPWLDAAAGERATAVPVPKTNFLRRAGVDPMDALSAALAAERDPTVLLGLLRGFRNELKSVEPREAARMILVYLGRGEDLRLPFELVPGKDGSLESAPTLRVWMLDLLGLISPSEAAHLANAFFDALESPDEYAMHLRNYAWGADLPLTTRTAVIKARFRGMIDHLPWRDRPSSGFAEAFDVIVYTDAVEFVDELCAMVADRSHPVTRKAAYSALDRLLVRHPQGVLPELFESRELLEGEALARAGFFARADLGDDRQAEVVERYLRSASIDAAERAHFYEMVPNNNLALSSNLLSKNHIYSSEEIIGRIRSTLTRLEAWSGEAAFAADLPALEQARARLERILSR